MAAALWISILFAVLASEPTTASATQPAPPDAFPNTWLGTWRGPCTFTSADGTRRAFEMELRIAPTDDALRYTWTIVYIEADRRQERPYELVVIDAGAGEFLIDEHNSIRIDSRYLDGALYSQFAVGQVLVTASYRLADHRIAVELITSNLRHPHHTGGEQGVPPVNVHPVRGTQRASLEKRR
jgi:hypothetical protein